MQNVSREKFFSQSVGAYAEELWYLLSLSAKYPGTDTFLKTEKFHGAFTIKLHKGYTSYLGHIARGEGAILQEKLSDVRLTIPPNVHCTVKAAIHTYHTELLRKIPEDECLVAPIVDISCDIKESAIPFKVQIPHCVQNEKLSTIKIRTGDIHTKIPFKVLTPKTYYVDKTHVTFCTHTFSQIICSACDGQCTYNIGGFLFGSNYLENPTTQTCKTRLYLCGPLYDTKDYREVGIGGKGGLLLECKWF